MPGNLTRLFRCRSGEFKTLPLTRYSKARILSTAPAKPCVPLVCSVFWRSLHISSRFPGFVFPCLGVHPVQEASPQQQRGACLQVGAEKQTNNHRVLTCTCSVTLKRRKHLKLAFFLFNIFIIMIIIMNDEMTPGELPSNRPVNRGQFHLHHMLGLYIPVMNCFRPLQLFPGQSPSQSITGSSCSFLFMQDLDAALPLIHAHKDQLVAIGEVTPDVNFVLSNIHLQ